MLLSFLWRLIFEHKMISWLIILAGHLSLVYMIWRIEKSKKANDKMVIVLVHFITLWKILSWASASIRNSDTFPRGVSLGVMTWVILTTMGISAIEPNYVKASAIFGSYWSLYFVILMFYYRTVNLEELIMFWGLVFLIYHMFKQNYEQSISTIEISYDFHNDPLLICQESNPVKANKTFTKTFAKIGEFKKVKHYSQMLAEV